VHFLFRIRLKKRNRHAAGPVITGCKQSSCQSGVVMENDSPVRKLCLVFLAVSAIALYSYSCPAFVKDAARSGEAYYKNETVRRLTEQPGRWSRRAIALLREEDACRTPG